ncbi:hypothetical protein SDC9_181429 [bioreactor metagenome]|uniref:Uncharacterized protein n=1 Tax=bioreactor metagenome TaxID=1076179 RepID=A0A645H4K6_9ZZZZ
MFDIPSNNNVEKCIITKDTVLNNAKPEYVINESRQPLKKTHIKKQKREDSAS